VNWAEPNAPLALSNLHKAAHHEDKLKAALFVMAALWKMAGHYNFALWFLYFFFLLFSPNRSAADWMSTILPHMVWP